MSVNIYNAAQDSLTRVDGSSFEYEGAGYHNSIYRGKNLGSSVTAAQWNAILNGTFQDMFIGDYWTINGVNWRIAAFDYWLGTGNTECTVHHVVIVPDSAIDTGSMNSTSTTVGGYVGSEMYASGLDDSKAAINTAFGSSHVLSHQELLTKAVADGKASSWGWYASTVEIMSEAMVYGLHACSSNPAYDTGIDRVQLPLFAHRPNLLTIRSNLWLRDIGSGDSFCILGQEGAAFKAGANGIYGIRPAFAIYQPQA